MNHTCPPVLSERVTLQSQTTTTDGAGSISTTWTTVATIWARMKPVSAAQVALAGRDDGVREYDMIARFRTDVNSTWRVLWDGRKFDVRSVVNKDEQRIYITARVREINA